MFGAGRIDESLAQAGIDHLVEHLALQSFDSTPYHWNGDVTTVVTRFHVVGTEEQVAAHLTAVARHLADLPVGRLQHEANILSIEAQRSSGGQIGLDLSCRFGARGGGLLGWQELGLRRLDGDEVRAWAANHFTRANAFLWLTGPPPRDLSLAALPAGSRMQSRTLPPQFAPGRSLIHTRTRMVSVSMITGQQWGIAPGMEIVRERALNRLRRVEGITYAVQYDAARISTGESISALTADAGEGHGRRVLEELGSIVDQVAADGPTIEELERLNALRRQALSHPQSALGYLNNAGERQLLGLVDITPEEVEAAWNAITPSDVANDLNAALASAVAIAPHDAGEVASWNPWQEWSTDLVDGHPFLPIPGREKGHLTVGDEGVTWTAEEGKHRTVRWRDLAACLAWDSGSRQLIGLDGVAAVLTPWNWYGGEWLTQYADHNAPADRRIPMGAGTTTFLRDGDDPASVVEVRWLASVIGARHQGAPLDMLVRTDGLALLYGAVPRRDIDARLAELRSSDRDALLAKNQANRWVPRDSIRRGALKQPGRWRPNTGASLVVETDTGDLIIALVDANQVQIVRDAMPKMLAGRFEPSA
jgi:hypothetical protein